MRNILISMAILSTMSMSATIPYLTVEDSLGSFLGVQLSDGTDISHLTDRNVNRINMPSGTFIERSISTGDYYSIMETPLPSMSIHFTEFPELDQVQQKDKYLDATLDIDGKGIFDDVHGLSMSVKGRGNSSWKFAKKPMRLKFKKKTSMMSFENVKNYVLLANYIDETHMRNAIALWLAKRLECKFTNGFQPVDVFINDRFTGLYLLTQKIGLNGSSVDIDENQGILLELSSEFDEPYQFRSAVYSLPVMVKDPDFDELYEDNPEGMTPKQRLAVWKEDFEKAEAAVASGKCAEAFDIKSAVSYMMVYDIVYNNEIGWPKSLYIHKDAIGYDDNGNEYKYVFGPVWDFDVSMNRQVKDPDTGEWQPAGPESSTWYHTFLSEIRDSREFEELSRQLFDYFYTDIYPELIKFIDNYADTIKMSTQLDSKRWNATEDFGWQLRLPANHESVASMKEWLIQRVEYLRKQYILSK